MSTDRKPETVPGFPLVSGKITEVTADDKGEVTSAFVEEAADGIGIYDQVKVFIDNETQIFKGYTSEKFEAKDLHKGLSVEAIFVDEYIIMIYPPQARAKVIRVFG